MATYLQWTLVLLIVFQSLRTGAPSPFQRDSRTENRRNDISNKAFGLLHKIQQIVKGRKIHARQDFEFPFDGDGLEEQPETFPDDFPDLDGIDDADVVQEDVPEVVAQPEETAEEPSGPRFMRRFRNRLSKVRQSRTSMATFAMCSAVYTFFCGLSIFRDVSLNKYCVTVPMEYNEHCFPN